MPSRNDSTSCCPVCLQNEDIHAHSIQSAVPENGGFENRTHADSAINFRCVLCGEFVVTDCDYINLKSASNRSRWNSAHVSALLREQTAAGLPPIWLRDGMDPYGPLKLSRPLAIINLDELLNRWPRYVPERIDRTICNLARLSPSGGHWVPFNDTDFALGFAENVGELIYVRRALVDEKFLDEKLTEDRPRQHLVRLTPRGWAKFDELTRGKSSSQNPVFVAMWFGGADHQKEMEDVFMKAIQPAIEQAGYRATRSDLTEHNDWIMDKVLGDIRVSPFVVADFTEHRNGVYMEAGFARGLGIPVIHTCREDHLDKVSIAVWN